MGFLKEFFRNVFHEQVTNASPSSFEELSEEELETHLNIARYGDFVLTDAIRPSFDLKVMPRCGFRHDVFSDDANKVSVPVLMGSASTENLFNVFMDLLDPLGDCVDVVLETSHTRDGAGHRDLYREHIDMPVLKSILYDYEEMLLNDGCAGIAVLNPNIPLEVQFDEHKILICYGQELSPFEKVFREFLIECDDEMQFITEAEHVHASSEEYHRQFDELKMRLGMDCDFS
ncbi:MAG: hypothetical protein WBF93_04890 [Pirellulales bacterium]